MKHLIVRTPLIRSDITSENNVFLKPENLQVFGSYKIRGVVEAIQTASPDRLKNGLYTASAGNMAQAIAFAARTLKIPCVIYVPSSAPEIKKQAIWKLGADLVERPFEEIWDMVRCPPIVDGLFIHPVLTEGLQKGYGQIATEILQDLPSVDAVVIPFGVGGLSLGLAKEFKKHKNDIKIFCCEPETSAPLATSLKNGYASQVKRQPSFVDAIGTPEVLPYVFGQLSKLIEKSFVVSIAEAHESVQQLANKNKLICEGAAGVAFAAAKQIQSSGNFQNIVAILSGGNIPLGIELR